MQSTDQQPMYWDLLSSTDQYEYKKLQYEIQTIIEKNTKSRISKVFDKIIAKIQLYITKGDTNDKNRSLVCGILWIGDSIAINTRQLSVCIGKCKSSINSGFISIGYETVPAGPATTSSLLETYPFMRSNFSETRQWTFRKSKNFIGTMVKNIPIKSEERENDMKNTEYIELWSDKLNVNDFQFLTHIAEDDGLIRYDDSESFIWSS